MESIDLLSHASDSIAFAPCKMHFLFLSFAFGLVVFQPNNPDWKPFVYGKEGKDSVLSQFFEVTYDSESRAEEAERVSLSTLSNFGSVFEWDSSSPTVLLFMHQSANRIEMLTRTVSNDVSNVFLLSPRPSSLAFSLTAMTISKIQGSKLECDKVVECVIFPHPSPAPPFPHFPVSSDSPSSISLPFPT